MDFPNALWHQPTLHLNPCAKCGGTLDMIDTGETAAYTLQCDDCGNTFKAVLKRPEENDAPQ